MTDRENARGGRRESEKNPQREREKKGIKDRGKRMQRDNRAIAGHNQAMMGRIEREAQNLVANISRETARTDNE